MSKIGRFILEQQEAEDTLAAYESQRTEKENENKRINQQDFSSHASRTEGNHLRQQGCDEPAF